MIKRIFIFCALILSPACFLSARQEGFAPVEASSATVTVSSQFKVYLLIKAGLVNKPKMPGFAYRQLKSYPAKVRDFLLSSKHLDFQGRDFKKFSGSLISDLSENKKKNSVIAAERVFDYVSNSITAYAEEPVAASNQSARYALPADVIKAGRGNAVEKCRLAVALLRCLEIPARMAFWDDHYVVQYFLKPLESEKIDAAWQVMDFTGSYGAAPGRVEPVAWHPVTSRELLGESWDSQWMSLAVKQVKNTRMEINEAEALALFTNIERGNMPETQADTLTENYYLLKEITYEITMPEAANGVKVEFTLPFNESQPFKTLRYFVSGGENLKPVFRKTHTMINPPNSGLVYTLPVEFAANAK